MTFPRYEHCIPADFEELGLIPEHWRIVRLKNILAVPITDGPHETPKFTDEGIRFLSVDGIQDGELQFTGCRYISEDSHLEYRKKALPQRDDLLMGKAASTGKIARVKVDFEFSIWSPLALIRVNLESSAPAFVEYCLKSPFAQSQIDNFCTSNTQKNISMGDIPKLVLPLPPLPEQRAIASFLDRETSKIDALVDEQRKLIELLKEKRQAVISHAVTKGLNPDAPMKDSGIEWLGMVPEHWEVCPLKYLTNIKTGYAFKSEEFVAEGAPVLRIGDIGMDGKVDFSDAKCLPLEVLQQHADAIVEKRDIVMAMTGATIGKAAIYQYDTPALLNQRVCIFRAYDAESQWYIWYVLQTNYYAQYLAVTAFGGAQPNISDSALVACRVTIPPIEEQRKISALLDERIAQHDSLVVEAERAIDLLQERRTALISAAVTGKIDVRQLEQREVA